MGKKHYTAAGQLIDMGALAARHANAVAIGNASMNARGDKVDKTGVVLKTQEQIEEDWRRERKRREESVGLSPNIKASLPADKIPEKIITDDQDFEPDATDTAKPAPQRRRKIVDAD